MRMARLDVLVHKGCFPEQTARGVAREIQAELPAWEIAVRQVTDGESVSLGIMVFPAFLLNGRVLATGIPKKDWLVGELRRWEQESAR